MGAEKASPGVTRRVLLTTGGLTLLGIWAADPIRHVTTATATSEAHHPHSSQAGAGAHAHAGQAGAHAHAGQAGDLSPHGQPARHPPAAEPPARPHPSVPHPARTERAAARPGTRAAGQSPMFTVDDGPKAVALTIDDGPNPIYTPQVLALLARYRVTATFSMIGTQVQAYPAVAREVAAAGHLIANHTWTHPDLTGLPSALVAEQMSRATDAIHAATGRIPDLFRAPYGAWSPFVLAQCARTGMTPLDWSVDPRDWSRPGVASIVANIMRNTRSGSIILEHDGGGDRSQTVAALKIVIPRLLAAGYHFRTP
jgi:peptidoglycan-N-acetylglucosamine deacetylase